MNTLWASVNWPLVVRNVQWNLIFDNLFICIAFFDFLASLSFVYIIKLSLFHELKISSNHLIRNRFLSSEIMESLLAPPPPSTASTDAKQSLLFIVIIDLCEEKSKFECSTAVRQRNNKNTVKTAARNAKNARHTNTMAGAWSKGTQKARKPFSFCNNNNSIIKCMQSVAVIVANSLSHWAAAAARCNENNTAFFVCLLRTLT